MPGERVFALVDVDSMYASFFGARQAEAISNLEISAAQWHRRGTVAAATRAVQKEAGHG